MFSGQVTSLLHGWSGLLSAYSVLQGALLAGLIHGRAGWRKLLLSPLTAVPLTAITGIGLAAASSLAARLGLAAGSMMQLCAGAACSAALGYTVGRALTRRSFRT